MSAPPRAGTKVPPPAPVEHPWPLATLPHAVRQALLSAGTRREFATGEVLYLAGAQAVSLYLVLEGRVRLIREQHTRTVYIHDEGPGGTLGEVPLFEGTTYPATAVAAEPTRCLVIARDAILPTLRRHPELAMAMLARLAARVRLLVDKLDQTSSQSILARLAGLLVARADAARGTTFTLGGTQQQAAEEIGTVRELVVRGLRTLRDRRAIESRGGGRYVVLDDALLRRIADEH
ncbi:MAG: Crp/Fnr family transcriptional regulator [bacterium]